MSFSDIIIHTFDVSKVLEDLTCFSDDVYTIITSVDLLFNSYDYDHLPVIKLTL